MKRALRLGSLTFAAVGTALALTATPASAHIAAIACTTSADDSSFRVRCSNPGPDSHQYRAVATCTDGATYTGPWYYVNSGNWSVARCPTNRLLVNRHAELR